MILEGLVTTLNEDGSANIAPMGPRVEAGFIRFELRPFKTSTTYQNLKRHPEGVMHVTDDALMIARAAIGVDPHAETRPARQVKGHVIVEACRYYEFRVVELNDTNDRTSIHCETVALGNLRDFFGFNRAKHAVIEAAILATRVGILPIDSIIADLQNLASPVEKTGGPDELEGYRILVEHVREAARGLGRDDLKFPVL